MDTLREKCPWDKKQTIQSLRSNTIEELYELVDAIVEEDWQGIKEELGDILLHVLFYAKIGTEQGHFTLQDSIEGISKKLIHRHPHIYGDVKADDEETVKKNWEQLKLQEGKKSLLEGVPNSLPSMVKAFRIQQKVKQVGFEWENKEQVWDKVEEEIKELQVEIEAKNQDKMEAEFGDVLFSLVNYARFLNIDPETALERTNKKFKYRFELMESYANENGLDLASLSLAEKDAIWNKMKNKKPLQ
jgi:XTP/dITP diphosphohydrolase